MVKVYVNIKIRILILNAPLEVTKGQIGGGFPSVNDLYNLYKLFTKFHAYIKKCTNLPTFKA